MYVFCDPSGHQPLHCKKTRGRLSKCSTTTPPAQSQEAQNPEIELHERAWKPIHYTHRYLGVKFSLPDEIPQNVAFDYARPKHQERI